MIFQYPKPSQLSGKICRILQVQKIFWLTTYTTRCQHCQLRPFSIVRSVLYIAILSKCRTGPSYGKKIRMESILYSYTDQHIVNEAKFFCSKAK